MAVHRVSVSLSEAEYNQLVKFSGLLGIKPTTAVHRSIKHGLAALSKEAQDFARELQAIQFNQRLFSEELSSQSSKAKEQPTKPQAPTKSTSNTSTSHKRAPKKSKKRNRR